jgi:hypothetical protein
VERWCVVTERLLALERSMPYAVRRMTYEGCVANPETEVAGMLDFLHLPHVPGLTTSAFAIGHDPGPADCTVRGSTGIEAGRGKGRLVDLAGVRATTSSRMDALMRELGYQTGA